MQCESNMTAMESRQYIAIDLKSFYASVECVERGLDPLAARLVVADASRTDKTICLAVSPALKALGIGGRARLFEVRQRAAGVDYIVAPPRMALYIDYSARIYDIYLRYIAPEDIHVYSVDEVFIDATPYLETYRTTPHDLAMRLIRQVLAETGITATAGIGTNLYLCKVAMDIVAKHIPADKDGVRIAALDELTYRRRLWTHRPLTDFWRVGPGIAAKLRQHGMYTMGDVARRSLTDQALLYRLFGVNAELLIDHAWGWEPVTIADIRAYRPAVHSLSSGQVLQEPYPADRARVVALEMADAMALDLLDKRLVTDKIGLTVGYDIENLRDPRRRAAYTGRIDVDRYGRQVPYHANGTEGMDRRTQSVTMIRAAVERLFDRIVNPQLLIRRLTLTANNTVSEDHATATSPPPRQLDLFADYEAEDRARQAEQARLDKERRAEQALLDIKKRFGKNSILKGLNYRDGATAIARNRQIGGHHE